MSSQQTREEYLQLHEVDTRIDRCKAMSQEIEHFENRIAKVEEHIRNDRFLELVVLVE